LQVQINIIVLFIATLCEVGGQVLHEPLNRGIASGIIATGIDLFDTEIFVHGFYNAMYKLCRIIITES
jgi:hypothetical protein